MLTRSRSYSTETSAEGSQSSQSSDPDSFPHEEHMPSEKKTKGRGKGRGFTRKQNRWVCIMPDSCGGPSADGVCSSSIVSLRDPSTNCLRKYLHKECKSQLQCNEICEILKFSDEPRSWFIDNTIHTDGSLYICTPLDPLFMALPYFQAAAKSGKFTTLDVILDDHTHNSFHILSNCVPSDQWGNISEQKALGSSDTVVYRYSKDKTMLWLQKKITALAEKLKEEKVFVGSGSRSSMFIASTKQAEITKEHYLNYSCGIICDYLNEELSKEILQIYHLPANGDLLRSEVELESKVAEKCVEPPTKKARHDKSEPLEDYSQHGISLVETTKVPKLTSAQKSLAKIDKTGMRSLSSFFKRKPAQRTD